MHRATWYMASDIEGIGGRIKAEPEDFVVDEIPAYAPSGEGPHLYIHVEKRDLGARLAIDRLASFFKVKAANIGQAGNKDRRAVTRQWFSVVDEQFAWDPENVDPSELDLGEDLKILAMSRHGNKLKTGHLWGNRFCIRLRDVPEGSAAVVRDVFDVLARNGLPNFFGAQRFGRENKNITRALVMLNKGGRSRRGRFDRRMVISALQSWLFNRVLALRMDEGLIHQALPGDIFAILATGGLFELEDTEVEQTRLDAREIIHTGPIFGHRMWQATQESGALGQRILDENELTLESFRVFGKLARGTRRRNLVFVEDYQVDEDEQGLVLTFSLPKGTYATVVLDEISKREGPVLHIGNGGAPT